MLSSATIPAGSARGAAVPNFRGAVPGLDDINTQPMSEGGRRWWRRYVRFAALLLAALMMLAPQTSHAQVLYGSLTGNVTDPKDAAVPGAKVEVVQVSTGASRTTVTDDRGSYTFSNLLVGTYKIIISMSSFKTLIKEDISVEANTIHRF